MTSLATTYLGIPTTSPVWVAACSLSNMIDRIQRAEQFGAGGLVIRSLFEEQIRAEQAAHEQGIRPLDSTHLEEARMYFPTLESDAAKSYFLWIKKSREAVKMPLIASLNASSVGSWVSYARELEKTGINAIELNLYYIAADPNKSAGQVEQALLDIVAGVRQAVSIPLSVKLSPFYTSIAHFAKALDDLGVNGLVLFNRFLQPDISIDDMRLHSELHFSTQEEIKVPLRWTAMLHGRLQADLALTTGVHTGKDAVKALLVGAQVTQVASILYQNGLEHLQKMNEDISRWMKHHQFATIEEFRGKLSQQQVDDPQTFERAQYVRLLMSES